MAEEVLSPNIERYILNGSETAVRFTGGRNVVLNVEGDSDGLAHRERDSSRVHTKNLSEYKWEIRSYEGRLLAVHGNYIAYRIFNDSTGEAVRVIERESRSRHLIKGFKRPTADLAWATHTPLLAVLDVARNLYIYSITENCTRVDKYLNLIWDAQSDLTGSTSPGSGGNSARNSTSPIPTASTSTAHQRSPHDFASSALVAAANQTTPRLSWCPYTPEDPDNVEDTCHMLAIYQGTQVTIVNISVLKSQLQDELGLSTELSFAQAKTYPSAILSLDTNQEVTCVNLSPDATAVAVGLANGVFAFYEMSDELRFVHHWNPEATHQVQQILFLEGPPHQTHSRNLDQEQFWRSLLAIGDDGRRLALFECENWRCLAKLRFDTQLQNSRLAVDIDPAGRFIFVLDVDAANLFCVELLYSGELPRFGAVTQVTFSHPIITLVPYERAEALELNESGADISLDDDAISGTGSLGTTPVAVNFIAITHRSVQQLDVTLEKTEKKDDNNSVRADNESSSYSRETLGGVSSAAAVHDELKIDTKSNADDEEEEEDKAAEDEDEHDHVSEKWSSSRNFSSRLDPDVFEMRMTELSEKVEQVTLELERLRSERAQYKSNADIIDLLQAFKEEFSLREDRLLANISDMIETSRADTVQVVRNALNENSIAVENSIAANHKIAEDELQKRIVAASRETMQNTVVPNVERLCALLYQKLNEQFRSGLQEFLASVNSEVASLRAAGLASAVAKHATPTQFGHDTRAQVAQLIKSNQLFQALQLVVQHCDQSALIYFCQHVDPDRIFPAEGAAPLPQPLLVQLLHILVTHLDADTEIRVKYAENVVPLIDAVEAETSGILAKGIDDVGNMLNDFMNRTTQPPLKRRLRMLIAIVRALIK